MPHFVDLLSAGQKTFTVLSLHKSNIYAKKWGIAKKLILTIRAIMIGQHIDLVAGHFYGTAWRCRSRDKLSTIDQSIWTVSCLRPQAPHHCGDLDPFWTIGQTSADFSNHLALNVFGRCISMVHFPFHGSRLVYVPPIKAAHHEAWLHLDFVDWSNTWSKQGVYEPRISLKERPAECSYGNPKRRISEIMSDHSLSS